MTKQQELDPWEAVNLSHSPSATNAKQLELKRQCARHFQAAFSTDHGKWVLDYLNGLYLNRDIVNPRDKDILVCAAMRQGEQNLLRTIHQIISYREGEENASSEETDQ